MHARGKLGNKSNAIILIVVNRSTRDLQRIALRRFLAT